MLTLLGIIYGITCVLLVIMVMLQSGRSGSMGLFGGGGSSTLGSQGGDIMTKITTILGSIFIGIAIIFAVVISRDDTTDLSQGVDETPVFQTEETDHLMDSPEDLLPVQDQDNEF